MRSICHALRKLAWRGRRAAALGHTWRACCAGLCLWPRAARPRLSRRCGSGDPIECQFDDTHSCPWRVHPESTMIIVVEGASAAGKTLVSRLAARPGPVRRRASRRAGAARRQRSPPGRLARGRRILGRREFAPVVDGSRHFRPPWLGRLRHRSSCIGAGFFGSPVCHHWNIGNDAGRSRGKSSKMAGLGCPIWSSSQTSMWIRFDGRKRLISHVHVAATRRTS
jgi:hypothetical protein